MKDRIILNEKKLDKIINTIDKLNKSLNKFESIKKEFDELNKYYGSKEWFDDLKAYDEGKIENVKAHVLSEDGVWNMLENYNEIIDRMNYIVSKHEEDLNEKMY